MTSTEERNKELADRETVLSQKIGRISDELLQSKEKGALIERDRNELKIKCNSLEVKMDLISKDKIMEKDQRVIIIHCKLKDRLKCA